MICEMGILRRNRTFLLLICGFVLLILYGNAFFNASLKKNRKATFDVHEAKLLEANEKVFRDRNENIMRNCKTLNKTPESLEYLQSPNSEFLISEKHSYIYCMIPKAGASFWKNALAEIEIEDSTNSKFEDQISDSKLESYINSKDAYENIDFVVENAMTFMFTRDPYDRIFSAYLDLINHPDTDFWGITGKEIVAEVRKNPTTESLKSGQDVTFAELISYLVNQFEKGEHVEKHFAPTHTMCDPCSMHFDYIGKTENFAYDAFFITSKVAETSKSLTDKTIAEFKHFDVYSVLDNLELQIYRLFQVIKETKGVLNYKYEFLFRFWRILQIRGHISKKTAMPLTMEQASNIDSEEFFIMIKKALAQMVNKKEANDQRTEALIQAYRSVPIAVLEKLKKYVERDCLLFGYDSRPEKLFNRQNASYEPSFRYFDGI